MNSTEYQTRHFGLAAFLRFCLGDDAHISTARNGEYEGSGFSFTFADEPVGRCNALRKEFFDEAGAGVDDARLLLETSRSVKKTMRGAGENANGVWRSEGADD